jgi:hypothetical protein
MACPPSRGSIDTNIQSNGDFRKLEGKNLILCDFSKFVSYRSLHLPSL